MSEGQLVGKVVHYYDRAGVAVVDLSGRLRVGERIRIEGKGTNLEQDVRSMQIEHANVEECKAGSSVGLKVDGRVREGDKVYRLS